MPGLRGSLCPGATDNSQTGCLPASQVLRSAMRASQSQTKCQTWGWAPPKYTTDTITPPRQSRAPTSADRPLVPGELGQPCKAKNQPGIGSYPPSWLFHHIQDCSPREVVTTGLCFSVLPTQWVRWEARGGKTV